MVEDAVKIMIDQMDPKRFRTAIVLRSWFCSFTLHHREPRLGRNPKEQEKSVDVAAKAVPHFKPGKAFVTVNEFSD